MSPPGDRRNVLDSGTIVSTRDMTPGEEKGHDHCLQTLERCRRSERPDLPCTLGGARISTSVGAQETGLRSVCAGDV